MYNTNRTFNPCFLLILSLISTILGAHEMTNNYIFVTTFFFFFLRKSVILVLGWGEELFFPKVLMIDRYGSKTLLKVWSDVAQKAKLPGR